MRTNLAVPRSVMHVVRRIYTGVEFLLSALLAVMAIGAVSIILHAPEIRARAERQLAAEIFAENRQFCERRGLAAGSHAFLMCTLDLNAVREAHERRLNAAFDMF
jgi:hypothetical protein